MALGAGRIGAGEHLLGGDVGEVALAPLGLKASAGPADAGQQPDRQVGSRSEIVQRVQLGLGEARRGRCEGVRARSPGRDRVVLVQPADVRDLLPQQIQGISPREAGVDQRCPRFTGPGENRPADRPVGDHLDPLPDRDRIATDPTRVDAIEQARGRRAAEADQRALYLGEVQRSVPHPGQDLAQGIVGCVLQARQLDIRVGVGDVDQVRPGVVGSGRDRPRQRLLAELGIDNHRLAVGDVGSDGDGKLRESGGRVRHGSSLS
jgi:hypothetical protein